MYSWVLVDDGGVDTEWVEQSFSGTMSAGDVCRLLSSRLGRERVY
jgi:hypothetical protein